MPTYSDPVYNLSANAWVHPNDPLSGPADHALVPVQLYVDSRSRVDVDYLYYGYWVPPVQVRYDGQIPADPFIGVWIWECPAGSGRYYRAFWKEGIHQGFPNEYCVHYCSQCDDQGVPGAVDVIPYDYT